MAEIKLNRVSERDLSSIDFIEMYLRVEFSGDKQNPKDVQDFLNEYLEEAEYMYNELAAEYSAWMWEH